MKSLFALYTLLVTLFTIPGQNLVLEDGYYKIGGDDKDFVVQLDGLKVNFFVDGELAFSFDESSAQVISDRDYVKYSFKNTKAEEWMQHYFEVRVVDNEYRVRVAYAVLEYSDFLKKEDMTPQNFGTTYFEGPFTREVALGK